MSSIENSLKRDAYHQRFRRAEPQAEHVESAAAVNEPVAESQPEPELAPVPEPVTELPKKASVPKKGRRHHVPDDAA